MYKRYQGDKSALQSTDQFLMKVNVAFQRKLPERACIVILAAIETFCSLHINWTAVSQCILYKGKPLYCLSRISALELFYVVLISFFICLSIIAL